MALLLSQEVSCAHLLPLLALRLSHIIVIEMAGVQEGKETRIVPLCIKLAQSFLPVRVRPTAVLPRDRTGYTAQDEVKCEGISAGEDYG